MNYSTVEITLDGNKMPVCFNMLAIGRLAKRAGISVGEVFNRFGSFSKFEDMNNMMGEDLDFVYELIHVGLEIGARVTGGEFDMNVDQVACVVGFDADIMFAVFDCFAESMPQDTTEENKKEQSKKKATESELTIDSLQRTCFGVLGMREDDFWASTLRSIVNRIEGYYKHYELQTHEAWERARMISFFSVTPHTKKGKIKSPGDLIKFPWENKPETHFDFEATKARALALFERDRIRAEQKANGEIS